MVKDMFHSAKVKAWEWSRSLWMLWTLIPYLNFVAFLYAGMRSGKKVWMAWGVFYSIPLVMLFAQTVPRFQDSFWGGLWSVMLNFGLALVFLVIGMIHALVLRREYLVRRSVMDEVQARNAHDLRNELEMEYDVSTRSYVARKQSHKPPKSVRSRLAWTTTSQRVISKELDD
ncbi:MAG: hypothetical protein WCC10_07295 [Tumebacillaceae bacterium]